MISISVKELRDKLPSIRNRLKKGDSFLVIYQSKPIAKLTPVSEDLIFEEAKDEDLELAALNDFTEEEVLTDEELNYYLNLK